MHIEPGQIAVVTGGGSGIGRELARQLGAQGVHVAMCDWSASALAETQALCRAEAPAGTRVTTFQADVSQEAQVLAFRDKAPTSAAQAATLILDGVRAGRWRILVGDDAHQLDAKVRQDPEHAYDEGFHTLLTEATGTPAAKATADKAAR